jgi:DnaJ-class molecular chaperone
MSAEHSLRTSHHRQPRRDANHWGTDGTRHPGLDPAACETCRTCPTCSGSGVIDTSPPEAFSAPWLQSDTGCPDCGGRGERGSA